MTEKRNSLRTDCLLQSYFADDLLSTLWGVSELCVLEPGGGWKALKGVQLVSEVSVVYRNGFVVPLDYLLGRAPSPSWRWAVTLSLAWQNRLLWRLWQASGEGLIDDGAPVPGTKLAPGHKLKSG